MKHLVAGLVAFTAAACTTVKPVAEYAHFISAEEPQKVWITRSDHTEIEIGAPRVVGDTLFGFRGTDFQEIPLETITQVRAVRPAHGRTAALALSAAVVVGTAYWTMNSKGSGGSSNCTGNEEDIC
ncbi:MAG TPA: hypothetical protein VLT79_07440 [Gemmatimonadales bacterium]|nr:hypothetical protein [Gemmatimonadales bacterium]